MSQVSKNNLESVIQKELFDQLYYILSQFSDSSDAQSFLSELLTKTERVMVAKRLGIAVLLTKGYTYRNIRQVLKVSFPTIRSVQFWLDHGSGAYRKVIEKIGKREKLTAFLEKVDKLLDKVVAFLPEKKGYVDPLTFSDRLERIENRS